MGKEDEEEPKTPQWIPQGMSQGKWQKIAEPEIDISLTSKRLLDMQKDLGRMLECRRADKTLRAKYPILFRDYRITDHNALCVTVAKPNLVLASI